MSEICKSIFDFKDKWFYASILSTIVFIILQVVFASIGITSLEEFKVFDKEENILPLDILMIISIIMILSLLVYFPLNPKKFKVEIHLMIVSIVMGIIVLGISIATTVYSTMVPLSWNDISSEERQNQEMKVCFLNE